MRLGIRTKFLVILGIAAMAPLLIGLVLIQSLGKRQYLEQQGAMFTMIAQGISLQLDSSINERIQALSLWSQARQISRLLPPPSPAPPGLSRQIEKMEAQWSSLANDDPSILAFLRNPLALDLKTFQSMYPLYAEVFVTDDQGRLFASTNKTSDYWQADEDWWQKAMALQPGEVWVVGIQFDESSRVYSLDVAEPLYADVIKPDRPIGVIKGVLNISPLLGSLHFFPSIEHRQCQVVMGDGRILSGLFGAKVEPLQAGISPEAARRLAGQSQGWFVDPLQGSSLSLAGYARLDLSPLHAREASIQGVSPMFVVVHDDLDTVLAPIRRQSRRLLAIGTVLIVGLFAFGIWIAERRILWPLRILHKASYAIQARAELHRLPAAAGPDGDLRQQVEQSDRLARAMIDRVEQIRTGDEFEQLALGFSLMARRVLHYHEQLENEIETRTEQIEIDLKMAREFLESFLPKFYPSVPSNDSSDGVTLDFFHVYKPALSVGGDFFDITKLDDHRAGIFIADVMGHGARSALVTAMLRALLQNLHGGVSGPAELLTMINRHFHDLMPQHDDMVIFATAFYMVLDTRELTASYASAGHPLPILLNRFSREVDPLPSGDNIGPALGLLPQCHYHERTEPLRVGDIFLLFTDGVIEALSPSGEEFGIDRLLETIDENIGAGAVDLSQAVLDRLHDFMDDAVSQDDICMVSVEIQKRPARGESLPRHMNVNIEQA